jgi:hypothetical protein
MEPGLVTSHMDARRKTVPCVSPIAPIKPCIIWDLFRKIYLVTKYTELLPVKPKVAIIIIVEYVEINIHNWNRLFHPL